MIFDVEARGKAIRQCIYTYNFICDYL